MKKTGFIFFGVLLLVIMGPFFIPVKDIEGTVNRRDIADKDSLFIAVNDLEIHYKKAGSGEPVYLLLHGFGASVFTWRDVLDPLSKQGQVIAYDRPAFGLTERPTQWEGASPYSPEFQVELAVDLMDVLGIDEAILVGNSAGGTIALEAALRYPHRVKALILVDAAVYTGGGTPAWIRPLLLTPQMDHLGPLLARRIANRGDEFLISSWHDPAQITEEIYQGYRQPLQLENWDQALWELTRASTPLKLDQRLKDLTVPTLVVTGDDDQVVPTNDSIRLAGEITDADLVVFENCGHLPQEECPEAFLEAVLAFTP